MRHVHDHLQQVPLFSGFTRDEMEHMRRVTTEITVPAGHVLMEQGGLAHEMVVVLEGTLEVLRNGVHVADIGPGGFAGEMALLTDRPRNSRVAAKTDVTLLHIDGRGFSHLMDDVPHLAVKMLPIVAARVSED